ncbi:MAG: hypothetical protein UY40_C0004G0018 [candidate division CPR1 bacterium GW2011_GWC1_49_13]|uniref:Transposase IS200-like domain-containing protein n=1 Tax=candidate division CPR1 bacterium GW2011_GWC1_49_13 TaxID=1618342 RepID=A0A0G1YHZ8_9BACT|nr:MAG: hypothetical protein UY40_C0004G0018 [candidate division CPR1 bacterium GW2011_GWC1_49_13]
MPSKYVVRNFQENSFYHVFNQGVEKRPIFLDETDYATFLYYLTVYLLPIEKAAQMYPDTPVRLYEKNLTEEVKLIAYCLMPNHFHLLLKQETANGVSKLLKQLTNAYTLYFNQKYQRVGALMQGPFRAAPVTEDKLFIHLVRFIHLNPLVAGLIGDLASYRWSSYNWYLGNQADIPTEKDKVLAFFPSVGALKGFHEDKTDYGKNLEKIKQLKIDD